MPEIILAPEDNPFDTLRHQGMSLIIHHDSEGDDIQCLILCENLDAQQKTIYASHGNPKIRYVPNGPTLERSIEEEERQARVDLTEKIFFGRVNTTVHSGSLDNQSICAPLAQQLANSITPTIVINIASFKTLDAVFKQAKPGALEQQLYLTYGSVNLNWILSSPRTEQSYKAFYAPIAESGATFIQIEAYPFLGTRNTITLENTPLSYSLYARLDGAVGIQLKKVNADAVQAVRSKYTEELLKELHTEYAKTNALQKAKIVSILCGALHISNPNMNVQLLQQKIEYYLNYQGMFFESKPEEFIKKHLNQGLYPDIHGPFSNKLRELKNYLNEKTINVYLATCYEGQSLISDQLTGIMAAEMIEERRNGIMRQCQSVQLDGLNKQGYARFRPDPASKLFYLDTQMNVRAAHPEFTEEQVQIKTNEIIAANLKYIDFCLAISWLKNEKMVSLANRLELMQSDYGTDLNILADEVQTLGFDLPHDWQELKALSSKNAYGLTL